MICSHCGAQLENNQSVCPNCGQRISQNPEFNRDGYVSSSIDYTPGEPLSRRRDKAAPTSSTHTRRERGQRRGRGRQRTNSSASYSLFENTPHASEQEETPITDIPQEAAASSEVSASPDVISEAEPQKEAAESVVSDVQPEDPPKADPQAASSEPDRPSLETTQETTQAADTEPAEETNEEAEPSPEGDAEDSSVHIDLASTLTAPTKEEKATKGFKKRFFKWLLIFLALAVVGVGAHVLVTKNFVTWQRFFNTIFGKEVDSPYVPAAIMEISEKDGKYLRTFSVHGENNYKLIVDSLGGKEVQFKDGVARVTIEDSVWIPEEPDPNLEYLEINLQMHVMDDLGYSTEVEVDPFLVYVPETPVEFEFPTADTSRVYEETATLVFSPPDGSAVTINGNSVAGKVDESGKIRYEIPVEMGDNEVAFEATMPFVRPLSKTFNIRRTLHDVEISLAKSVPHRTQAATYTINGVVEPGAKLSTKSPGGKITLNKETGKFSFTADLATYGLHKIVIHAEKDGREPADLVVQIERIPDPRTYASSASSPDIAKFVASPASYKGKKLYFNGMVQTTEQANVYDLQVGKSTIAFTYHGTTRLNSGDEIRIYGNYHSVTDDGKPMLSAWFITK